MLEFDFLSFYVMGKAFSGELSCTSMWTDGQIFFLPEAGPSF